MAQDVIKSGDWVIADENGEKKSIVLVKENATMRVGKLQLSTEPLIGAPWGSMWELPAGGSELVRMTEMPSQLGPKVDEIEKDNSKLVDRNEENQSLKMEDIEELKRQGKAGAAIVEALCTNSATFDTKTEFAQDKYIKRKSKKYVLRVTLRRPTGRTLCEALFEKTGGQRTWNLRPDSLAAALCFANVAAGARVLVIEACQGLVAAACAERLGGDGAVVAAAAGDKTVPPLDGVRLMNFGPAQRGAVRATTLHALTAAARRVAAAAAAGAAGAAAAADAEGAAADAPAADAPAAGGGENGGARMRVVGRDEDELALMDIDEVYAAADAAPPAPAAAAAAGGGGGGGRGAPVVAAAVVVEEAEEEAAPGQQQQQQQGEEAAQAQGQQQQDGSAAAGGAEGAEGGAEGEQQEEGEQQQPKLTYTASPELLERMVQPGFSSCVIANPKLHPGAVLRQVLPLLAPSAAFVVFSPWQQPLAEAMAELAGSGRAVMLQLSESWMRPYQVLPGRTHPNMSTFGTGGYLLSGIKREPMAPQHGEEHGQQAAAAARAGDEAVHVIVTGFGEFDTVKDNPTARLVAWLAREYGAEGGNGAAAAAAPGGGGAPAAPRRALRRGRVRSCTVLTVSARAVNEFLSRQLAELTAAAADACGAATARNASGAHAAAPAAGCAPPVVLLLHFGVDVKRRCFNLETRAANEATFRCPDAEGWQPQGAPVSFPAVPPAAARGEGGGGVAAAALGEAECAAAGAAAAAAGGAEHSDLDLPALCAALRRRGHDAALSGDAGRFVCNWTYHNSLRVCRQVSGGHGGGGAEASGAAGGGAAGAPRPRGGGLAAHSLFVHVPGFEAICEEAQRRFAVDLIEELCEQLHATYWGAAAAGGGGDGGVAREGAVEGAGAGGAALAV
ncbi:MAG: Gcd10p family-domain-containing protein [Monoraphidium minutum]|nr:MAG: Gcd10p family-domain-containing protein [Monoraphidium minutum]